MTGGSRSTPPRALPSPGRGDAPFDVPAPRGATAEHEGDVLTLELRWFRRGDLRLIPPTLLFNAIVVAWFAIALNVSAAFAAFGLLHLLVGLWLALYCACHLVNKTTVTVHRTGPIKVAHGPIPVLRRRTVDGRFVQLDLRVGRPSMWTSQRSVHAFEVWATQHDGARQCLLGGIDDRAHALYLEQEIERFLDLPHRSVDGGIDDAPGVGGGGPPAPPGVEVLETSSSLAITMSRRYNMLGLRYAAIGLLFLAVGVALGVAGVLQSDTDAAGRVLGMFIAIALAAAGAVMIHRGLVATFNATAVVVDRAGISVRNGPLPVFGGAVSVGERIVQVYGCAVTSTSHFGRHPSVAYDVYVILDSGERIRIVRAVGDRDHADYLERKVEGFLGIEDRAVRGEMRRSSP